MEKKIKIIDQICTFHPSFGTDKGWSEYTGGMKDSGMWYYRKMLAVPIDELSEFLDELKNPPQKEARVLTEEEKQLQKEWVKHGDIIINKLQLKDIEEFARERELRFLGLKD